MVVTGNDELDQLISTSLTDSLENVTISDDS